MKIFLLFLGIFILLARIESVDNKLNEQIKSQEQQEQKIEQLELKVKEATKGAYLRRYFRAKGSVLADYATHFVNVADRYNLPLTLLPAIGMAESGGCAKYIRSTNNCFGWGGGYIYFNSIGESIERVAKTITESSLYKKFQKEKTIRAFALNYNASYASEYEKKINYFLAEIESYK